jgi:hypothetical protein
LAEQLAASGARNTTVTDNGPAPSHSLGKSMGFALGQALISWDVD